MSRCCRPLGCGHGGHRGLERRLLHTGPSHGDHEVRGPQWPVDRRRGHLGGVGWAVIIVVSKLHYSIHKIVSLILILYHTLVHIALHEYYNTPTAPKSEQQNLSMATVMTEFLGSEQGCGPSSPCCLSPLGSECCCELRAAAVSPLTRSADCSDHATSAGCCSPQHNR